MEESEIEKATRWETWLATRLMKLDTEEIIRQLKTIDRGIDAMMVELFVIMSALLYIAVKLGG